MNVMELMAKIGLDTKEYDEGMDKASGKFSKFGSLVKSGGKALGSAFTTTLKATGVAIGGAVAGIGALTKSAYSAYADYEQLTGGVETLFGSSYKSVEEYAKGMGISMEMASATFEDYQKRSETVMANANKAYMTAGLSANEYMEQVTGFSAALNASLGENAWQSANYADLAITNMADNANKMGTDIEAIQNAYNGFAKGNFTMLDNLKLGYGGTKEEMERLLRDAEELEGLEIGSLDKNNFADIIEAIDIIQTELGISGISLEEYNELVASGVMTEEEAFEKLGTTAKEASGTLSGSFATMQGAWTNFVAGLANPDADMSANIDNLVLSVKTLLKNAIPVISQALSGIGQAVSELIPILAEEIPALIEELLPPILSAATSLVETLASNLPSLLDVLVQQIPTILPSLISATVAVFSALASELPTIITMISDVLTVEVPKLLDKIDVNKFTAGLGEILSAIGNMIVKLAPKLIPQMVKLAIELIKSLANGFSKNASQIVKGVIEIINVIVAELTNPDTLVTILKCAFEIVKALAQGIADNLPLLLEGVWTLIENLIVFLVMSIPEIVSELGQIGATIVTDLLPNLILTLADGLSELIAFVVDGIGGWASKIGDIALSAFSAIGDGALAAWDFITGKLGDLIFNILGAIGGWFSDLWDAAKSVFGAIGDGLLAAWDTITTAVSEFGELVWSGIEDVFSGMFEYGKKIGNKIWEGIKSTWKKLKEALDPRNWGETADSLIDDYAASLGLSEEQFNEAVRINEEQGKEAAQAYINGQIEGYDIHSPSKKMAYIGRMVMAGFSEGIEDQSDSSFRDINSVFENGMNDIEIAPSVAVKGNGAIGTINQALEMLSANGNNRGDMTFPIIVGGRQIDEVFIDAKNRITTRSGGRVYV